MSSRPIKQKQHKKALNTSTKRNLHKKSIKNNKKVTFSHAPTLALSTQSSTPLAPPHSPFTKKSTNTIQRRNFFGFGRKKTEVDNSQHDSLQPTQQQQQQEQQQEKHELDKIDEQTKPKKSFNPASKFIDAIAQQFKSETSQLGNCVGVDSEGNKFFEYREKWMDARAPARRRVEFATDDKTTTVHELWDSWLRHSRQTPPSPEEFTIYMQKRQKYLHNVERVEYNDAKARQQEQLQHKLHSLTKQASPQDPSSARGSVMDILKKMEQQLAEQRLKNEELKAQAASGGAETSANVQTNDGSVKEAVEEVKQDKMQI